MKIGIITFHGAHNYGSVLQAYALQQTILNIGHSCEIINFRTEIQKDLYNIFTKRRGIKYILKNIYFLLHYKTRRIKYNKFEDFINNKLILTKEYNSIKDLYRVSDTFDCFISGSDQIWNIEVNDFDRAYFLPFTNKKKISYATSCGPSNNFSDKSKLLIKSDLNQYNSISVRDLGTHQFVSEITGENATLVLDPTFLLSSDQWKCIISDNKDILPKDYIFLYTLSASKELIAIAKILSKKTNLPVIVSNITNQYDAFAGFKKILDSGPCDFLSYIKNAKYVLTTSYHATIFSIIFQRPFLTFRGLEDNRIGYLLNLLGLEKQSVSLENVEQALNNINSINYKMVNREVEKNLKKSYEFLRRSMEE